jgi:hypothetical protein
MANPRKTTDYVGVAAHYTTHKIDGSTITFDVTKANGSAQVGLAVTMTGQADDTVALTSDGDEVAGKLIKVDPDGYCTVQDEGGMTLPGGASATLTVGSRFVGALGASSAKGYIRAAATPGGSYSQSEATDSARSRGEIKNNDTTTAVKVVLF